MMLSRAPGGMLLRLFFRYRLGSVWRWEDYIFTPLHLQGEVCCLTILLAPMCYPKNLVTF